jgi:predicted AlkP superfamily pyrophosphatase or phosphodiesterase
MRRRPLLAAAGLTGALAAIAAGQPVAPQRPAPRLLVILVVDQMRADAVAAFQADWTGGLRRLLDEGAWFSNAAYPYGETVTCTGHATVATGTFPSRHGIIGNTWFDRSSGRRTTCTEDPSVAPVPYGGSSGGGQSAGRLLAPTLGEHMQRARRARVAAVAVKARSAIMLSGRHADAVTWLSDSLDGWQTSTAFASRPLPVVRAFLDANPIDTDHGETWTRLLPSVRYTGRDDADGETPPAGWTAQFPHTLAGGGRADSRFRTQWAHSPFADAYVGRFAADLVRRMRLGQSGSTDVLGLSFSAPDSVGHAFGPESHETRDVFARLDRTLGTLLVRLDTLVGRDHYVVALTSDHGVEGLAGTRARQVIAPSRLSALVEEAASETAGDGRYVAAIAAGHVYFRPGMYERIAATRGGLDRVLRALTEEPGILRAFGREQVAADGRAADEARRALAMSYVPDRSGDIVLVTRPGFQLSTTSTAAANHGTASEADRRVPVILAGPGIRHGRYDDPITPADISPTLAAIAGAPMPGVQGRVLQVALVPSDADAQPRSR